MSSFKPAARRVVSGGSKAATADRNNNNNNNAATASSAAAPGSTSAPQNGSNISYSQEFGPGVKAGAGGSVVSTGLNDLDRLFGGGVPLGSLIILYEVCHCALSWPSNFQRLMSKTIVTLAADPASTEVVLPRPCTASPSHSACRYLVLWPLKQLTVTARGGSRLRTFISVQAYVSNTHRCSQDAWGEHAATLLKYFMAEGLACRQQLLHLHDGGKIRGLLDALPKLLPAAGESSSAAKAASAAAAAPETELKIAWQYKRCGTGCHMQLLGTIPPALRVRQNPASMAGYARGCRQQRVLKCRAATECLYVSVSS